MSARQTPQTTAGERPQRYVLKCVLPGQIVLERGTRADYRALERFHYRRGSPATFADVWVARHRRSGRCDVLAAAAVLSYPALGVAARAAVMGLAHLDARSRAAAINAGVRTISRVVVHPVYRGVGLGAALVRCLIRHCPVRYIEALAMMAHAHPLFERAGMRRITPASEDRPVYYVLDRWSSEGQAGTVETPSCGAQSSCSSPAGPIGE